MSFKLKKRGQAFHVLMMAFIQLVLASSVFLMFYGQVSQIRDSTYFDKLYLTRDLSLIATGLSALPENFQFPYVREDAINFTVIFEESIITVEENRKVKKPMKYGYGGNPYAQFSPSSVDIFGRIDLIKNGNDYFISADNKSKLLSLHTCSPAVRTVKRIVVDPGHSGVLDLGLTKGQLTEEAQVREVGRIIYLGAGLTRMDYGVPFDTTRDINAPLKDEVFTINQRINLGQSSDAFISLHIAEEKNDQIRVYFNAHSPRKVESNYLACLTINNLLKNLPEAKAVAPIPIDLSVLDENDQRKVLAASDVAVFIELGTLDSPFAQETEKMGLAIKNSLKTYK